MAGDRLRISARHALNDEEMRFCRIFAAMGGKNQAEAYRRAFFRPQDGWTDDADAAERDPALKEIPAAKTVSKRAETLLKQEYIVAYLEELKMDPGATARAVLFDQAATGDDTSARRAAEQLIAQEDKIGIVDAAVRWAEIMCQIGVPVKVPLPTRFQKVLACQHCGQPNKIDEPLEARFQLSEMFPGLAEGGGDGSGVSG